MSYTHEEHLHRFACWTAARAAQRGWAGGTTTAITAALKETEFSYKLEALYDAFPSSEAFDIWHADKVGELMEELVTQRVKPEQTTYGRVAKVIAIYIKTVYVAAHPTSALAWVAHPPIDAILLRNVKAVEKKKPAGVPYPVGLGVHWSTFDKEKYQQALGYLRKVNGDKAFWEIEVFWKAAVPKPKMP
jgi:hypothetical protein